MSHPEEKTEATRTPATGTRRPRIPGHISLAVLAVGVQAASVASYLQQQPLPIHASPSDTLAFSGPPAPQTLLDDRLPEDRPLHSLLDTPPTAEAAAIPEAPPASPPPPSGSGYVGPENGFNWNAQPLPAIVTAPPEPVKPVASQPAPPNSSELPDEQVVALSRLANPQLEVRGDDTGLTEVSAEKPLGLRLSLSRSEKGYRVGDAITAQVSASSACYATLLRVDAAGKAIAVFQSVRPTRQFTCMLKAGPLTGAEYLLAVASAYPLNGAELSALLKGSGNSFPAAPAAAGTSPGVAWKTALDYLGGIRGQQRKLQRHEWAVTSASFATQATETVVAKPEAAKQGTTTAKTKPAGPDGSALPGRSTNGDTEASNLPNPKEAAAPAKDKADPGSLLPATPANNDTSPE